LQAQSDVGAPIRHVLPAMAATLAAYAGLAFAAGLYMSIHERGVVRRRATDVDER
jgi:hypothetical protein